LPSLQLRWQAAVDRGWLRLQGRRWQLIDPQGMDISNQVLVELLLWWQSLPADAIASANLGGLPRKVGDLELKLD
jgi:oxygen-independent coproporphyrinogen-3 oxidase